MNSEFPPSGPGQGGALREQLHRAAGRAAHEQPPRTGGGDAAGVRLQGAGRRRRPRQEGRREHPRGAHPAGQPGANDQLAEGTKFLNKSL